MMPEGPWSQDEFGGGAGRMEQRGLKLEVDSTRDLPSQPETYVRHGQLRVDVKSMTWPSTGWVRSQRERSPCNWNGLAQNSTALQ